MSEEIIRMQNVSRVFYVNNCETIFDYLKGKGFQKKRKITAVDDINFEIQKGEFVGLLGINGAGKSTLIKMLTGIMTPSSGEVRVFGNDPFERRLSNNYKIGAVFGQRCQLRWDISPMESYKLYKEIYNIPDDLFQARLNELVSTLGLGEILLQPVRTLSLGQKMRAELAGAFLHNPEILFLDEPTLGLDVVSKEAIIEFLGKCKEKGETTVIFTTHDMEDVKRLCERLIIINQGKLLIDDTAEHVIKNTPLNASIVFEIEKGEFQIPEELKKFRCERNGRELSFQNICESGTADVISKMCAANSISRVDIRKPEFKDIFMNLFEEGENNEKTV